MTLSFVLRLLPGHGDDLVGEVESVRTGERTVVRGADDLVAHLRQQLRDEREPLTPA